MANTYVDYTAVAAQTDYNFSFEYLRDEHVKVKVDGVETSDFTIVTSPTPTKIRFNTAPSAGAAIKIYRDSRGDFSPLVDFVDGSILTENELDEGYKHNLFLSQEASEGTGGEQLTKKGLEHYDAEGNKIINLFAPSDNTDAANKAYVDQTIDTAIALGGSPAIVSLGGYDVTALGSTRARSLASRFSDYVNVLDYGAAGTGYPTDDSSALQAAINTGKPVYIPAGNYYVPSGASYAGAINVFGDGDATVLTTDGNYVLYSSLASNSSVRDFRIERRTNPTTVVRDWGSWTTSTVGTTGEGYMPGPNDAKDGVWTSLTPEQQDELGGWIQLVGQPESSGTYGKNISVENISSKFGSILIENCEYVTVRGCRLHGERAAAGCITIKNYEARANGAPLAKGILIDGNICEFSAYNGISVDGTEGAIISNNITGYSSETGIKLWQDGPGEPTNRGTYKTIVVGNSANFNFEDGYNICSRYPNADTDTTYYQATGNYAYGNGLSGFNVDGRYNLISSNHSQGNGVDGIVNNSSYSLFTGNYLKDNNASNQVTGRHEFTNNGVYNTIANNYAYRFTTRNGTGFYMGNTETLNMIGNTAIGPNLGVIYDNAEVLNSIGNFGNGIPAASSVQEFRSDASTNDSVNVSLTQAAPSGTTVSLTMKPRSTTTNPAGGIQCLLAGSTPGSEIGELALQTAISGTLETRAKIHYGGHFVPGADNSYSLGISTERWSTVYAATGTINTSDKNEKQQIVDLSQAERQVATAIKGLIKKFKFNDAVEKKGDKARIHVGVIAQDVEQAFITAGLNPEDYGIFCKDVWWSDAEGKTYEEEGEDRTQHTRLGVRYEELLAFVIASM